MFGTGSADPQVPMWKLTIVDDEGTRTVVPLARGEYNIGRDAENTIRLTERNISRKHLMLKKNEGDSWVVEDLSSYNGCFVNGLRVSGTHPLHTGDLLQVGDYRLEILDDERAAVDAPSSSPETLPAPPVSKLVDLPDRLIVIDGEGAGTEHALEGDRMLVGRAEDADICVNHSSVSRIHAEIIRITPGTYEIIDRASSNGIRVNGIKADRRVIEDGDEVELGDVRMRFVARGRIFRLGAQPALAGLPAASPAATISSHPAPRRGGLGMMIGVGAVLGIVAVVGFVLLRPRPEPAGSPAAAMQEDPPLIAEARSLAAAGDLEGAQSKLATGIPEDSVLRDHAEVKRIAGLWADSVFASAAKEPEPDKKRAMLARVSGAKLVDSERRKRAADELLKLDTGATDTSALPVASAARPDAGPAVAAGRPLMPNGLAPNPFEAPPSKAPPAKAAVAAADTAKAGKTKEPPAPAAPDPGANPDKARELALQGGDSETKARKMLEGRVWSGKATVDEIRMLKAICRHQHDGACVSRANAMLQQALQNQ
jgi:pSer/pThr/pTyr-binding forkhead associated (FHA) protein